MMFLGLSSAFGIEEVGCLSGGGALSRAAPVYELSNCTMNGEMGRRSEFESWNMSFTAKLHFFKEYHLIFLKKATKWQQQLLQRSKLRARML